MKRNISTQLKQWKSDKKRKPLLLMGARQVGKTYVLKEFGRLAYKQTLYLNFEDNPTLVMLFENSLEPSSIIKTLGLEYNIQITPETTLIVFDEVQECPNALNSLKYFQEQANEYHICAASSLLGVKLRHTKGFPVGKVNFLHLYPFSFEEFLLAINEARLVSYIHEIDRIETLPTIIHQKLLKYFKYFLFTGGMPEAVAEYIDSENFEKVRKVQNEILLAYNLDFAKHAPRDSIMKINQVWKSIPGQLAKENKKFIYSILRKGARAKEFEEAIQWLVEAGLVYKTYHLSTPKIPLDGYVNFEFFKMFLLDVGLLGSMVDLPAKILLRGSQVFQEFRGSFIENYVAQSLALKHPSLYYWTSEGKAELDFVIQHDGSIYPIEVKSGNSKQKKSWKVYNDKYHPPILIRCSPNNMRRDGQVFNCPLYLVENLPQLLQAQNLNA